MEDSQVEELTEAKEYLSSLTSVVEVEEKDNDEEEDLTDESIVKEDSDTSCDDVNVVFGKRKNLHYDEPEKKRRKCEVQPLQLILTIHYNDLAIVEFLRDGISKLADKIALNAILPTAARDELLGDILNEAQRRKSIVHLYAAAGDGSCLYHCFRVLKNEDQKKIRGDMVEYIALHKKQFMKNFYYKEEEINTFLENQKPDSMATGIDRYGTDLSIHALAEMYHLNISCLEVFDSPLKNNNVTFYIPILERPTAIAPLS